MLDIYSSSAGSGKTYTLTREYLQLALNNSPLTSAFDSDYFKSILAITFTNDAANEMKSRITMMLRYFYEQNPSANFMLGQIEENINIKNKAQDKLNNTNTQNINQIELRRRAKEVFMKIIYDYSDFSVSTIDTFANKVVAAFTQELNMPFNYATEVSTGEVLQVVAENILSKVGETENHHPELTGFMVEYALYLAKEGTNFKRIAKNLADFGDKMLSENATQAVKGLAGISLKDFIGVKEQMKKITETIENQLHTYANTVKIAVENENLTINDFSSMDNSIYGHFEKVNKDNKKKKDYPKFLNDKLAIPLKQRETGVYLSGDNIKKRPELIPKMESLRPIIEENYDNIEIIKKDSTGKYILYKNIEQQFFNTSLINELQEGLTEYQDDTNINLISNNNKRIATIVQNEPVPFIYERIGEKYRHLLVDEFQDTSVLQWENLLPLIENSLSQGSFNMLVGDVKQSIYRWRGGKMQQMLYLHKNELEKLLPKNEENPFLEDRYGNIKEHIESKNMTTNFRSTKEVVDFNNAFFKELKDIANTDQKAEHTINEVYDAHFEQLPSPSIKTKGEVRIVFKNNKNEEGKADNEVFDTEIFTEIDLIIKNSLEKGFSYKDIAIICNKNDNACSIANYLKNKELPIPVVSKESLLIASNEVVCMLVAFMKVLAKPDFSIAKAEALYLFYKEIKHQIPDTKVNEEIRNVIYEHKNSLSHFFDYIKKKGFKIDFEAILSLSLYEMVEELLVALKVYKNISKGQEYVFRFLDYVLEFSQKSNDLSEFLEDWDTKRKKISIQTPKDINAITLVTIHKSKGLEFPVVIIPFANWTYGIQINSNFWVELPENTLPTNESNKSICNILYPTSDKKTNDLTESQLAIETEQTILESVNKLYVAFTRAIYDLHIITKAKTKKDSIGHWLQRFVQAKTSKVDGYEGFVYNSPDKISNEIVKITHEHKEKTLPDFVLKKVASSNEYKKLHLKK